MKKHYQCNKKAATPLVNYLAFNKNPKLFKNDPSFIYRCINMAAGLRQINIAATINHFTEIPSNGAHVTVLHRPNLSLRLRYWLYQWRRMNTLVVADIDDLIFDPSCAKYSPAVSHHILPLKKVEKAFTSTLKALSLVDVITVSTTPLADKLKRLLPDKPVIVINNCVHSHWRQSGLLPTAASSRDKVLTYMVGTRSHDYDFLEILEPVENFLFDHPQVKLKIIGPLSVKVNCRPDQMIYRDKLPFSDYMAAVRSGWVNLMPLEQTPFNECKSALKVIEAGYWGIPTVCSPNPDAERLIHAGAIIACNKDEWRIELERLLDDGEYTKIANGLRERTLSIADISQQLQPYKTDVLGL